MASDPRTRTIWISLTIAVVLIVGAFYFSGHRLALPTANAESTQELLKAYASKDSDGDGLPDWQESLYGTDPNNAHSVRPTLTDSEAVAQGLVTPTYSSAPADAGTHGKTQTVPGPSAAAGSLTDQFSQLFFTTYMNNRGATPPSADEMQSFVQNALSELNATEVRADIYTSSNLKVEGQGAEALKAYAAGMDRAYKDNTVQLPYDELTYFADAVEKNDTTALGHVSDIGNAYLKIAKAAAAVPVPSEAAAAQLGLVNALARLGTTITDMASVNQDPIRAMLGLQTYGPDVTQLVSALQAMDAVFAADNVTLTSVDPGSSFYHLLTLVQTQAAAATTP